MALAHFAPTACGAAHLGPHRSAALLLKSWAVAVSTTHDHHLDELISAMLTAIHRPTATNMGRSHTVAVAGSLTVTGTQYGRC